MGKHLNQWERYSDRIASLSKLGFNYDVKSYEESVDKLGWNIDRHSAPLGTEAPGEPEEKGIFARAKLAIQNYEFPDPDLITALFNPGEELNGRNMLMEAKFVGLKFYFGVRITAVIDEEHVNDAGHQSRAWGYAYRTLQGHFEIGEIRFVVTKDKTTGLVEFRINAYSRPDRIGNLFYSVGFRLFGRPLQRRFSRSALARMQEFAKEVKTSVQKNRGEPKRSAKAGH